MFARISSVVRLVKVRSLHHRLRQIYVNNSKRSRYDYGSQSQYRRRPPPIGATLAGVTGTAAVAYIVTTKSDGEDMKTTFLELLTRTLPRSVAACSQEQDSPSVNTYNNYETRARNILKYCQVNDKQEVDKIIKEMRKYLKDREEGSGGTTETEMHLINDAIHGPIELSPLLYQIINTSEFHRLKGLRQLGGIHYVYPGANHTRFEHSIGVSHVAGKFARYLKHQLEKDRDRAKEADKHMYRFEDEEVLCAELAGLCHDLGHGPLSHMFEKVMGEGLEIEVSHEDLSVAIFKRMLVKNPKVLGEFVREGLTESHVKLVGNMIKPPDSLEERDERLFLYEIVANKLTGIDVDKWDYYQRDCHYLGVLQDFQWRRSMLLGRIVMTPESQTNEYIGKNQLRIGFRDKEMENLYGMFRTRANIHQKACQHKTIKAVEKMIMEAMTLVQDLQLIWVPSESSQPDKGTFKSIKQAVELAANDSLTKLDWYLAMTDSIVGSIMSADACTEKEQTNLAKAKCLLKRVEQRDLYTCSAKKRVPKFFHPVKFLQSQDVDHDQQCITSCESCALALAKDRNLEAAEKLFKNHKKRQEFEKEVYNSLLTEEKSIIGEDNIWVDVVRIKLPSEKNVNPIDEVLFFEKPKRPNDLPKVLPKESALRKASMIVVPQAFIEYEVRVYDKRSKAKRKEGHQKALKEAMDKAWKKWLTDNSHAS